METTLVSRSRVAELLTVDASIEAVEKAFRLLGEGRAPAPSTLGVHVEDGGFHVKAGAAALDRLWFAVKINANFPSNPDRFELPTIQGLVALFDAENGQPLALFDSGELTALRTAAATAVAARAPRAQGLDHGDRCRLRPPVESPASGPLPGASARTGVRRRPRKGASPELFPRDGGRARDRRLTRRGSIRGRYRKRTSSSPARRRGSRSSDGTTCARELSSRPWARTAKASRSWTER